MAQDFTRKQVAALERRYDFKTAKSLGQNFVTDPSVTEAIIEAAGAGPEDLVLEIGPGLGVITSKAAQRCGRLVAIEVDKKLLPILAETVGWQPNVKIINEDILQADLEQIVAAERTLPDGSQAEHVRLIGNLPYGIKAAKGNISLVYTRSCLGRWYFPQSTITKMGMLQADNILHKIFRL